MAPFSKMAPRRSLALISAPSRSVSPYSLYIPCTVHYAFLFIMSLPITLSIKTYYNVTLRYMNNSSLPSMEFSANRQWRSTGPLAKASPHQNPRLLLKRIISPPAIISTDKIRYSVGPSARMRLRSLFLLSQLRQRIQLLDNAPTC
jgi:hypothetical protein